MTSNSATPSLHQGVVFGGATTRDPIVSLGFLTRISAWLLTFSERRRQRYTLAGLSDYLLADLGLSPSDVSREIGKWPWQV